MGPRRGVQRSWDLNKQTSKLKLCSHTVHSQTTVAALLTGTNRQEGHMFRRLNVPEALVARKLTANLVDVGITFCPHVSNRWLFPHHEIHN